MQKPNAATLLYIRVAYKIGILLVVTNVGFGFHANGLDHWIDRALVLDGENLWVVDQVIRTMFRVLTSPYIGNWWEYLLIPQPHPQVGPTGGELMCSLEGSQYINIGFILIYVYIHIF